MRGYTHNVFLQSILITKISNNINTIKYPLTPKVIAVTAGLYHARMCQRTYTGRNGHIKV